MCVLVVMSSVPGSDVPVPVDSSRSQVLVFTVELISSEELIFHCSVARGKVGSGGILRVCEKAGVTEEETL